MNWEKCQLSISAFRALKTCGAFLLLTFAIPCPASWPTNALSRSVLMLDQSDAHSAWYAQFSNAFRSTLHAAAGGRISVYAEHLDLSRFGGPQHDDLLRSYLRDKFRTRPIGLLVAQGSSTLEFVLRSREELWTGLPVVFAAVDEDTGKRLSLPLGVTGTLYKRSFSSAVTTARVLVPKVKRLALVGDPWERQAVRGHYRREIQKFEFEFIDLIGLPMTEIRKRVAALPDDTVIIYTSITFDGAGTTYVPHEGLAAFADVANRPIVIDVETNLGHGGTGGFVTTPFPVGEAAARLALRILNGEPASKIPVATSDFTKPIFDWRQLQRFGINESRLPAGSEIRFRPPNLWEQHRDLVLAALSAFALQTLVVSALLIQQRRRKRAEALLKESEERMTFTAASMNIGLWQFDRQTDELWATEHCRNLFGLGCEVPLTRETILSRIHPEDREAAISSVRETSTTDRSAITDVRVVRSDDQQRWVRIRARSHSYDRGAPSQLSGIFADITEQKAAEAEAALQRQEVAHLMRVSMLGELSGAIAHEINQPLTAILSNAQAGLYLLAQKSPDLIEIREVLRDIVYEDNRAGEVVHRVRSLLKKGERKFETINVNDLINSTIALLNSELISRRIKVKTELADPLPSTWGDPIQLQQVLVNLFMNAMDAMVSTPMMQRRVVVSSRAAQAGAVEVLVKDHGSGISVEQDRLFEAFYSTKNHGLGLGLRICSTIVEAHGGNITLTNDVAGGAVATLSLPAQEMLIAAQ